MFLQRLFSFFVLFFSLQISYCQTGPGGVGTSDGTSTLEYWIDANNGVTGSPSISSWLDISGNGITNTISGSPLVNASSINGYNSITFNGSNTSLNTNLNINESVFSDVTIIAVYVPRIDNSGAVWGEDNGSWDRFILDRNSIGPAYNSMVAHGTGPASNIPNIYPIGSSVITTVVFREDVASGSRVYANSALQRSFSSNTGPETSNLFHVGQIGSNGLYFDGDIVELMVYGTSINEAQRIIIDNYLSAKYNRSLLANDFYKQDDAISGNYDFKVAGLGQATDGTSHKISQGTGVIRMESASPSLTNGEYLFWGENVRNSTYNFVTSPEYIERINTQWRVSEVGDVGTVTVSINASDIDLTGKAACATLQLVVDNNSDFSSPTTTYTFTESGGVYSVSGVNFTNNDYFTLQYIDKIVLNNTTAFNGSGALNMPDITDGCYKFLVKNTADGSIPLAANAIVRELEVEAGGKLVVNTSTSIEVSNGIILNGEIRLTGSSQLIQTHTGISQVSGSGNLYVDQNSDLASVYMYNYFSSPVKTVGSSTYTVASVMKDGTVPTSISSSPVDIVFTGGYDGSTSPLTLSNYWIYSYLNASSSADWVRKLETGTFNPGEGYTIKGPGIAQNYTFKGLPNDGDYSFNIDADNVSLLGNPYPSAIDADLLFTESTNLATIYFWEHASNLVLAGVLGHFKSNYIGGYSYRNATMGVAAATPVPETGGLGGETYTAPGQFIPIGQGFFAEGASGLAATVNFTNNQRAFETEAGDSHFYKTTSSSKATVYYPQLKIGFEAKNSDNMYIHSQVGISFSEGKTFATEAGFDSKKVYIRDTDIYFQFQGYEDELVIAGVEKISNNLQVPLTIKVEEDNSEVFLMLDDKKNINRKVFLKDTHTNIYYDFSTKFSLKLDNGIYKDRFYIVFEQKSLTIEENNFDTYFTIKYFKNQQKLKITNFTNTTIKQLNIYNIIGQRVYNKAFNKKIEDQEIIINTSFLNHNFYILSIETEKGKLVKKFF